MKESEYILVSNLQKLALARHILSDVLFMKDDPRRERLHAATKQISDLTDEIYTALDGKIEEDSKETD
jgi:hypothetical protein